MPLKIAQRPVAGTAEECGRLYPVALDFMRSQPLGAVAWSQPAPTCLPLVRGMPRTSGALTKGLIDFAITGISSLATGGTSLIPKLAAGVYQGIADEPLPIAARVPLNIVAAGGGPVNGFGDIFGDIGAFFTTEQTFGETLSNVGVDLWQGVTNLLPAAIPNLTAPLVQTLAARPQTAPMPRVRPPAQPRYGPEFDLGQLLRPPFMRDQPFTGVPPGSAPPGQWEIDTYGEPGTMGGGVAMAGVPMVRTGTQALTIVVNAMRSQGLRANVSWLAGILRKFGPAAGVGFLASWVEDQIANMAVWEAHTLKRRRMNPANVKALRRSARRIESFHRLCRRVDVLRPRGRSRARARCATCHRDPCRCK